MGHTSVIKAKISRGAKTSKKEGRDPSINCHPGQNKTNCPRISMQPVSIRRNLQFQKRLRIDSNCTNASTQSLEQRLPLTGPPLTYVDKWCII